MEIYYNGLILFGNYLLVTNGRSVRNSNNGIYTFSDGSIVNLKLGIIVTNNKNENQKDFTIITLVPGTQIIEIGNKNRDPQSKLWLSDSLKINYPGKVVITESTDGTISVKENEFCVANESNGLVSVSLVDYTKLVVNTETSSINEVYLGKLPTLEISAPANVQITNNSGSLTFDTAKSVELLGGDLTGNNVDSITGSADSSVEIKINSVNTLTFKTSSFLAISLDIANTVTVEAESALKINVSGEIKALNINGESSVEIKGGTFEKVTVQERMGSFNLADFTHVGK